jgi:hypothetical protein
MAAGVLSKLGGYELLRVFPVLFKPGFVFGAIWVVLDSVGGLSSEYFAFGRII